MKQDNANRKKHKVLETNLRIKKDNHKYKREEDIKNKYSLRKEFKTD